MKLYILSFLLMTGLITSSVPVQCAYSYHVQASVSTTLTPRDFKYILMCAGGIALIAGALWYLDYRNSQPAPQPVVPAVKTPAQVLQEIQEDANRCSDEYANLYDAINTVVRGSEFSQLSGQFQVRYAKETDDDSFDSIARAYCASHKMAVVDFQRKVLADKTKLDEYKHKLFGLQRNIPHDLVTDLVNANSLITAALCPKLEAIERFVSTRAAEIELYRNTKCVDHKYSTEFELFDVAESRGVRVAEKALKDLVSQQKRARRNYGNELLNDARGQSDALVRVVGIVEIDRTKSKLYEHAYKRSNHLSQLEHQL